MSSKSKGKGKKTPSQDKDKEEEVDWAEMARLAISAAPNDPASRRGMAPPADPQGQSPSAARAASQAQASMAAGSSRPVASLRVWQRNLAAFWRRHGAAFTSWWRRLSPVDRKSFILATAPFTPDERGKTWVQRGGERHEVHGQVILLPELNLADLCDAVDGMGLPKLMERRVAHALAVAQANGQTDRHPPSVFPTEHDAQDIQWIEGALSNGLLTRSRVRTFVIPHTDADGEEPKRYEFGPHVSRAQQAQMLAGMGGDRGTMDGDVFDHTLLRQTSLFQALAGMAASFEDDVRGKGHYGYLLDGFGCANCGAVQLAEGQKLLACGRCGVARYCSRECQLEHWRGGHKAACNGGGGGGAEGSSADGGGGQNKASAERVTPKVTVLQPLMAQRLHEQQQQESRD